MSNPATGMTQRFLDATRREIKLVQAGRLNYRGLYVRPRMLLVSGLSLSVQASSSHYCTPRNDTGPYTAVEVHNVGVNDPSPARDLLLAKARTQLHMAGNRTPATPYGWVPIEVVDQIIEENGMFIDIEGETT